MIIIPKVKGTCPYCKSTKISLILFGHTIHCNRCGRFCNPEDVKTDNLDKWITGDKNS